MLQKKIKFTQAKFEYYILQITPLTLLTEIETKLKGFKKLEHSGSYILLSVDGIIDETKLSDLVFGICNITKQLDLTFHAILKNDYIHLDKIYGVQVIDLPETPKSNIHIHNKPLISFEPLRSGMVLSNDGDIILRSFVSDNAEVIASGNIHVYGEAKGRLIAGSDGDKSARIFVGKFNAELVSIGGLYRTMDEKLPANILHHSVMISLDSKNRLIIEPMAY